MNSILKTPIALLLFSVALISCKDQTTNNDVEAEIISLARKRSKAVVESDTTTLSDILARDFTYINIWGEHLTRKDYLANNATLGSQSSWISQEMDSISVRVSGSYAIITFRVNDRFKYEGAVHSNFCRSTFAYELQGDGWKCVMGQTTKIE